jgi:hypothetical protein
MMGQPAAGGCQMVHWGSQLLHLPANSAETTGASAHDLCLNALSTETSIYNSLCSIQEAILQRSVEAGCGPSFWPIPLRKKNCTKMHDNATVQLGL